VLEEKLKGLAEVAGPDANRINAAHAAKSQRAREEKVPDLIVAALQKLVREIGSSESAFQAGVGAQFDTQIRQGANRELFQALQADVDAFTRQLAKTVRSIESEARGVEERVRTHSAALAERHAIQEAEYRTIVAASEEQGERATERVLLQTTFANAQSAANEQLAKEQQRQGMIQTRGELLKRASELRDQRFTLRKKIAERLSSQFPSIRVTVTQAADLEEYQKLVTEALKGARLKQGAAAERLCHVFLPGELADLVAKNDINTLMQRTGFDEDRSKKILSALGTGGVHYTIGGVALNDRPSIELLAVRWTQNRPLVRRLAMKQGDAAQSKSVQRS
jgi:hypothetical protein